MVILSQWAHHQGVFGISIVRRLERLKTNFSDPARCYRSSPSPISIGRGRGRGRGRGERE